MKNRVEEYLEGKLEKVVMRPRPIFFFITIFDILFFSSIFVFNYFYPNDTFVLGPKLTFLFFILLGVFLFIYLAGAKLTLRPNENCIIVRDLFFIKKKVFFSDCKEFKMDRLNMILSYRENNRDKSLSVSLLIYKDSEYLLLAVAKNENIKKIG